VPHDLFEGVVARPPAAGSRRASITAVSIVAHLVLVVGILVLSVVAPGAMPVPREALAFFEAARMMDIELPKPPAPRSLPQPPGAPAAAASPLAAPVVAPDGIGAETGLVELPGAGVVDGVPHTDGIGEVDGTGIVEPPPAPPPAVTPVRLHSGIRAPQKVAHVAPDYPSIARAARVQGIVILEATIDAGGDVTAARVLRSVPMLDDAALQAVRQWKFTPARLNGQPIPVVMTVTVDFRLN
jgi:protein TonB